MKRMGGDMMRMRVREEDGGYVKRMRVREEDKGGT